MTENFDKSIETHQQFTTALHGQSDLGKVLITATYIDDRLASILSSYLIEGRVSKDMLKGIDAPLGTLSARTRMAYAMGLISKREFDSINAIRKIRNEFAHKLTVSFNTDCVRSFMDNLAWAIGQEKLGKYDPISTFYLASNRIAMQLFNRIDHVQAVRLIEQDWPNERIDADPNFNPHPM